MSKRNKLLVGLGAVVLVGALVAVSAGARRDKGIEVRFEDDLAESVRAQALFVVTGVSEAFLDLQTAHRAVQIQAQNRRASEESLQLATERYRVGSGTFFELNDAQLADLTAQFDYVNSIYDYHKALALLEAAVGRSLR